MNCHNNTTIHVCRHHQSLSRWHSIAHNPSCRLINLKLPSPRILPRHAMQRHISAEPDQTVRIVCHFQHPIVYGGIHQLHDTTGSLHYAPSIQDRSVDHHDPIAGHPHCPAVAESMPNSQSLIADICLNNSLVHYGILMSPTPCKSWSGPSRSTALLLPMIEEALP